MEKIIFTGAGSNGKTTLKNELLEFLHPYGWQPTDATASGKKQKLGVNMKDPTEQEEQLFQALGFHNQLFTDLIEARSAQKIIAERCAIDFIGFTAVLTPNLFEQQKATLRLALERGMYERAKVYYIEPLQAFHHAYNRFSDSSIYPYVEAAIQNVLKELEIPHEVITRDSSVEERVAKVLSQLSEYYPHKEFLEYRYEPELKIEAAGND